MEEEKVHVLYIDDEVHNLHAFKANFRRLYTVFTAESAAEAREILKSNQMHVIITDQRMPNVTGIEFLESILTEYPDPIRMLLTGYTDINTVIDAINKGQIFRYITKPWNEEELKIAIRNAFEIYSLREENKRLMKELEKANSQLEFLLRQQLLS